MSDPHPFLRRRSSHVSQIRDSLLTSASARGMAIDLAKDGAKFVIGAAAGWLLKVVSDRWRTRRARAFWRPFLGEDVAIVVGRFQSEEFERSGLMGAGDSLAVAELQRFLGKLGARMRETVYADRLAGEELGKNLIVIGGPDANAVTHQLVERLHTGIRFGDPTRHIIAITDVTTTPPRVFAPGPTASDGTSNDFGVVVRAPNPFGTGTTVLIVAGAFGHGTWAGVRFAISKEFLRQAREGGGPSIECLIEADIVRDTPQAPRIVIPVRQFDRRARNQSS